MNEFADHPISLAERRANDAADAGKWSPRDAILSVLRDIDSGKLKVETVVIAMLTVNPEGKATKYAVAGAGGLTGALGVLDRAAYLMNSQP